MGLLAATLGSIWLLSGSRVALEIMVAVGRMSGYRCG